MICLVFFAASPVRTTMPAPQHDDSLCAHHAPKLFCFFSKTSRKIDPSAVTILLTMVETPFPPGSEGSASRPVGLTVDWAATLAEHDRWLRTAVFSRLREGQAVEEVMQEIALAAVAQRAPLNNPGRVSAWLYRLAIRIVLLYRRQRGRQRNLLGSYAACRVGDVSSAPDPLDWLIQDERRRLVREALGRLPRRDAEILLLKYTEDWSYRELAAHLGVGESAIEARLHRARKRLREMMIVTEAIGVTK
jgi:RNA polymerase sigma factor (sigma-70 family)